MSGNVRGLAAAITDSASMIRTGIFFHTIANGLICVRLLFIVWVQQYIIPIGSNFFCLRQCTQGAAVFCMFVYIGDKCLFISDL